MNKVTIKRREDELPLHVAASLKLITRNLAGGRFSPESMEVLRRAAHEFLAEIYRHDAARAWWKEG